MTGDVFLTVPRRFSSLFASAHVIGLRLGINQSVTSLDGVSAAPGKHMLHMCRKSLVINLFFSQISGFYPFELRWVSKMFLHCIKPSSSIMYNLWKWSDGCGRKSCIDCQAQHGRHHREITPTAIAGPRFHAPLHIFPPPPDPAGGPSRTWRGGSARWRHLM